MSSIILVNSPKFDYSAVTDSHITNELGIDNSYPVGLLLISSALKHSGKFGVDYLDANFYHLNLDAIVKEVETADPMYVGLNCTFPNLHVVKTLAERIKNANPARKIIAGGPAATLAPEYVLKGCIDVVVRGEGEETTIDLLTCFDEQGDLSKVQGIAYAENGKIILTPQRPPIHPYKIPLLDVSNIPIEIRKESKEITLFTSRGCEAYCSFCSTPVIWGIGRKNIRNLNTAHILAELTNYRLNGFDFDSVHFLDDGFTNDWERVSEFAKFWNDTYRKEGVTWRCLSRIKAINSPERIAALAQSNCRQISVGVESASPRIIKKIGKGLNLSDVDKFLYYCDEYPITKKGFFMLGFPDETEEEARATIDYLVNSGFDSIGVNVVMAYPGTRLYKEVYGEEQLIIPEFGKLDLAGVDSEEIRKRMQKYSSTPQVSLTEHISIERLLELKELAFELFYKQRAEKLKKRKLIGA